MTICNVNVPKSIIEAFLGLTPLLFLQFFIHFLRDEYPISVLSHHVKYQHRRHETMILIFMLSIIVLSCQRQSMVMSLCLNIDHQTRFIACFPSFITPDPVACTLHITNTLEHTHDDIIKWTHFPRYWPFARRIPAQRPVTRNFDVSFALCLNKQLSKQSWSWWFETLSHPLWCHCNV